MDIRRATAMVDQIPDMAPFFRAHEISRESFYKWRTRFREHGIDGMVEQSRRPHSIPGQLMSRMWCCAHARSSKTLAPITGRSRCARRCSAAPNSPLGRCRRERRLADPGAPRCHRPAPQKRPKGSRHRFVYPRPNDCWQSDWTHSQLVDSTKVAIAGTFDDHSRYLRGCRPGSVMGPRTWCGR